jgi:hypothetical protein
MKRIVFVIMLAFAFGNVRAQNEKEIGEAIMQSFQKRDSGYLRYYMPAEVYAVLYKKDIADWENAVKKGATWQDLSAYMEVIPHASSKEELIERLLDSAREEMHALWTKAITGFAQCFRYVADSSALKISEIKGGGRDQEFLVIHEGAQRFAFRFRVEKYNGRFYLQGVLPEVFVPDEKGRYACSGSCEGNQEGMAICPVDVDDHP